MTSCTTNYDSTARITPVLKKEASSTPPSADCASPRAQPCKGVATDWDKLVARSSITNAQAGDAPVDSDAAVQSPPSQNKKLELALLVLVSGCLLWTLWLIELTVHPNDTINKIMKTTEYDDGSFWLLIEPPLPLLVAGVSGFAIIMVGYSSIIVKLVRKRKLVVLADPGVTEPESRYASRKTSIQSRIESVCTNVHDSMTKIASDAKRNSVTKSAARFAGEVVLRESRARKFMNVVAKVGDIGIQFLLLVQIMEAGYPTSLVFGFTGIVVLNCLVSAVLMYQRRDDFGFLEVLIDTVFDFLIAVAFPMFVVCYCLAQFNFDRQLFAINRDIFPLGRFERLARAIADPTNLAVIDKSLNSLRIRSAMDFFTRLGTNLALCYHFSRLVDLARQSTRNYPSRYPKRHPIGLVYIAISVIMIVFVSLSISTSQFACSPHPECVAHAHRWTVAQSGDLTKCPCIALVDADPAPKSIMDWVIPRNVTEKVAQLAATGDLEMLQLINRQLIIVPEELRGCPKLKHVSLYYSDTPTLPEWFNQFSNMEYLHIEAKFPLTQLESLPDNLFENMRLLTFIHFGLHTNLRHLPSFKGLTNLKSLTLAALLSIRKFPNFDDLENLERLLIVASSSARTFPDMSKVKKLQSFILWGSAELCCNGFLDNKCDPSNQFCQPSPLTPPDAPFACLPANRTQDFATDATRRIFAQYSSTVCFSYSEPVETSDNSISEDGLKQCSGVLYRKCTMPGNRTGICYNTRLMPISCNGNTLLMEMRRRQIQERVGSPCDPQEEAWLGCGSSS